MVVWVVAGSCSSQDVRLVQEAQELRAEVSRDLVLKVWVHIRIYGTWRGLDRERDGILAVECARGMDVGGMSIGI